VTRAVVEPEAVAALIGFDATVRHYEVVKEAQRAPAQFAGTFFIASAFHSSQARLGSPGSRSRLAPSSGEM
jgi:hypothetical protein